ncbi:actin cross-linking protein [Citrus sinensis]|nr:actin cross-linking protein [Citrus sinensis]
MEFFNKAKAVRLRSHLGKYLVANDDEETVRQSHNGSSSEARWTVEFVQDNCHLIRLKSCYNKYLTASEEPFFFGLTGKKVVQTSTSASSSENSDRCIEWEPVTSGFEVKFRTRDGKFLRANGGTPPWRNSITHDVPHRTATQDWVLWGVDIVDILDFESLSNCESFASSLSNFSSHSEDFARSDSGSVPAVVSLSNMSAMEIFRKAKTVRLRSHHDKYLLAEDDEESVFQDRNGTCKNAKWTVEILEDAGVLRLKSCYGKYLSASNMPYFFGVTGKKVVQSLPKRLDASLEWEPVRDGIQVKLKTRYGHYLRANGGMPPWRNSITHDIPHRSSTQDWILWDVDIVEFQKSATSPDQPVPAHARAPARLPTPSPARTQPPSPPPQHIDDTFKPSSVNEGRLIVYAVVDDKGNVDKSEGELSFTFKGSGVEQLKQMVKEVTGLNDIIVCSRNPLNGNPYPLRLHLPPNNATMNLVVVPSTSKSIFQSESTTLLTHVYMFLSNISASEELK